MLKSKKIKLACLPVSRFAGFKFNRLTGSPAHRLTAVVFCLLCLSSVLFAEEEFKYDAKGKRNPFIPLVTSDGRILKLEGGEDKGDIGVEGIIYDKHGSSYAIVDGTVVRVGDFVGDYQVLKIEEKKVSFIKEGQVLEVELKKEEGE